MTFLELRRQYLLAITETSPVLDDNQLRALINDTYDRLIQYTIEREAELTTVAYVAGRRVARVKWIAWLPSRAGD